jgi:SAM-dependent methyltransferase
MTEAVNLYLSGKYGLQHDTWHIHDAANKVKDILPAMFSIIDGLDRQKLRIADVGSGAGGVSANLIERLSQIKPDVALNVTGFEISSYAIEIGRNMFPGLDLKQKFFEASDGPFDIVLFVDVLEHLENPWQMLRLARETSEFMVVRQPLLDNFSTFRHNNYKNQRETWGHISYFNYQSFLDMAQSTGWEPVKTDLVASWELAENIGQKPSPANALMTKLNRTLASFLLSGFYLNGAFRRV